MRNAGDVAGRRRPRPDPSSLGAPHQDRAYPGLLAGEQGRPLLAQSLTLSLAGRSYTFVLSSARDVRLACEALRLLTFDIERLVIAKGNLEWPTRRVDAALNKLRQRYPNLVTVS